MSIVDKHAPLITKKVRGLTCPWMNGSIKREIRQREFLLNKARRSNLDEDWSAYRRSRNRVTKLVRDSKSKYSQCRRRVKIIGGAHHERQSHEVLGSPGECSLGKFLYRGSLK